MNSLAFFNFSGIIFHSMRKVILGLILFLIYCDSYAQSTRVSDSLKVNKTLFECVQRLDQNKLTDAQSYGLSINKKVAELCATENRNKAQNTAYDFAQKIQKSITLIAFRKCNRSAVKPLTTMQQLIRRFHISGLRFVHICDNTQIVSPNINK